MTVRIKRIGRGLNEGVETEIPWEVNSLHTEDPLSRWSFARFRVVDEGLTPRTRYPVSPYLLPPRRGNANRNPAAGEVQRADRTAEGGLNITGLAAAASGTAFEFVVVDENGEPVAATNHLLVAGDQLYFHTNDAASPTAANAAANEPFVVSAVSADAAGERDAGLVTVVYRTDSPRARDYTAIPAVRRWALATGSDIISAERVSVPPAPSGLAAAAGDGQVTLSWDPPAFSVDSTQYRYRIGTQAWTVVQGHSDADGWLTFPAGTTDSGVVTNLENGIDYTLEVRFVTAAGAGDEAAVSATPRAALRWAGGYANRYLFAGTSYTLQLPEIAGGVPPLVLTSTGIPPGMALRFNGTDDRWELTGTPTTPQGLTAVTITARDNHQPTPAASLLSFEVSVRPAGSDAFPVFADDSVEKVWREGQAIVADDTSGTGGQLPAAASGDAPIGYSLSPALNIGGVNWNASTRRFSGTPNVEVLLQTYTLTVQDVDGDRDTLTVNLRVLGASQTTAMWPSINDVVVDAGRAFSVQIPAAMGSVSDYRFTGLDTNGMLESGVSPPTIAGLTYTNSTRTLSGTIANPVARTRIGIEARDSHTGEWVGTIFNFECRQVASAPAAPVSVTLTGGQRRLTVDFSAPAADDSVTGLEYEWRQARGPWITPAIAVAPVPVSNRLTITSFPPLVPRLGNRVEYGLRLRFVNAVGSGAWTEAADVRTGTVPGGVTITQSGGLTTDSSIVVAWSAATGAVSGYEISHKLSSAAAYSAWTTVAGGSAARSATVTGLTSGTRYDVRVRARNAAGPGTWQRLGCQTAFAPASAVTHSRSGNQYGIGFTLPASGAVNAADRATITGVRGWIERSIGYQPPGVPFSAVAGSVQGFASGSSPSGISNISYSALAGQWYRARVRVESGGTQSADAYSTPAQIPSGAQGGAGGQSAPEPSPHAPPGPQGQQQPDADPPPWVRSKWPANNSVTVHWGAAAGATGYFVEVYDQDDGLVLASASVGGDARSATLTFDPANAPGGHLRVRVASDPGRQFTSSEDGPTGPWPAEAFSLLNPVEVETALPHGLTDEDVIGRNAVIFERIAGTLNVSDGSADRYTVTRVVSPTVFHAAVDDTAVIVTRGGQRQPRWRKVTRTSETTPWSDYIPVEGDEIIITDPDAGPASPPVVRERLPDVVQFVRDGETMYAWFGASGVIGGATADDWLAVQGAPVAGYETVPRRAVTGVPGVMSNLTQVLPTNVIGWHDPPPDNLDLNALFTVEPLLPVADLQEIHGIAQEPPGAVDAGTRFQIAVQERALTHFPQLRPGRYIALENVHGAPSLLQRNIWRILSMPDPLRLDDPDDDDAIPVSTSSPVRARIRGVALTVGESSSHSAPYAGVATPTGIQAFDWQTFGIAKWVPATQGEATQFSFNAHNRPNHHSLPEAETADLRIIGMHYSPQGQHTLTVYHDLDAAGTTREVRNGGARIRFGWVWTADELTRLQAAQAAGGTWTFMLVSRSFASDAANDFDIDNLTWKGRTIDIANISREFQMQGLTATAHSRWRPLIRSTAQLRQRRGVLSIDDAVNNRARVTVEAGQQVPVSVSDIIAFEDVDVDLGASFGANRYRADTDEYIVETIDSAGNWFDIRAATGRAWRVDPPRDPFTFHFTPSASSAVRAQSFQATADRTDYTFQARQVSRIIDPADRTQMIEADGTALWISALTLSHDAGAEIGFQVSSTSDTLTPVALSADALANYRIYIRIGADIVWGVLSGATHMNAATASTTVNPDSYRMAAQNRPSRANWYTPATAGSAVHDVFIADTRSQFGFNTATRLAEHETTWMQAAYPQGAALPSDDRGNRIDGAAYDLPTTTLTLTVGSTEGLSAGDTFQCVGLDGLPDWWLLTAAVVEPQSVTASVIMRAAPTLDASASDIGYPYWREAALDAAKVSVATLEQARLFGGTVYSRRVDPLGRPNTAWMVWTITCSGYMRRLENAIINGTFSITGESTLGASLSSLIANYGTDAAGNALISVPPDIAGNAQRLQSPDDALAGRPASTVIDTTAWDTVLSGVTRLLENINGAARADAFGRLDITAPSEAPAVHPTVLDQDVNLVTAGIRIDPRQARTRTAEVGQPVDVGTITETFLGDGQGGTRDRPFVLSRRVDRTQYSAIRLALQGVGAEAPTTENLRLPGTQTTADWVLDGDLNAVYSTDDTPLTAQTRMFIDYVYAEPSLATLAGSEGGVTKRVDDPNLFNQLTAYHRALLENRLHPAPVIRAELPVTPWADAKDRVELPPPGAYCVLNLSMMGYQQVYALINNVTVTDRQGALHPVISAEVSPVPAALHHQSNRDFWRKLLHPPLSAAQRSINFGSQPALRSVPEEVVIRQGLNLPALLGGAATAIHTVSSHGGSGNPDGGRIIHGSIARVDGRRFPTASLRWHCMVRVHGDTTQALLFLWDPDAINPATMVKGVRLGAEYTVNKSTPAGADKGALVVRDGVTISAAGFRNLELRCRVTAGAATGFSDGVEIWSAVLDVEG